MLTVPARRTHPPKTTRDHHNAPVDEAKVARLREAVKSRRYSPSASAIAEIMLGLCTTTVNSR
ncbi:hypothetical protein Lgee_1678 [Legionella geestiana]|uniref:Anti-sigma-28 factor FlgM C-terminal domain-containing protein n=1 Tax=Legionella geestiana TaxID=45065 RepID=A0A0W0TQY4_9GAMM|nr:flagellar biosynthesis anti-sigma factor FlgM [Legionella geestiana]KTC97902.1 hypothetical protein Lgee_1678 [Legionella geestiana]QBS11760.1 flagellar biosynthesis anti-sigma factor FlgM [Legionella geestiana]QDQ40628.1 flagellar biosynthesis anti-sigma factor FlgM [Legionella geestiana]STX53549.1 Uncharacterised protein [Legionella geestiana]